MSRPDMAPQETPPFTLGPTLLFCPADRPDRFSKAAERADAVILDLEDAVAPEDKEAARYAVAQHLARAGQALLSRTVVRVNPPGTEDFIADAEVLAGTAVEYVMLAKAESSEQIEALRQKLPRAWVVALCETATGAAAAYELARHPATAALMWGAEDLIASIGGSSSRFSDGTYRDVARHARSRVLLAAASQGKAAIDSIYADIADHEGLAVEAEDAVGSGFSAKACIHPAQVEVVRRGYQPTQAQVEYAAALLAEVPEHGGVFQFRGAMVDGPLIWHARRILQRSEAGSLLS